MKILMAFGQLNKLEVKSSPFGDEPGITDDEVVVQLSWDAVRNTHSIDMQPLRFKDMNYAQTSGPMPSRTVYATTRVLY